MILLRYVFLTTLIYSSAAFALNEAPQTFTLDGRIFVSPTSTSPLLDNVTINVKILDPSGLCVLYEENQPYNTTTTDGFFNIGVGSPVGDPKRLGTDDLGLTMEAVYKNTAPYAPTNAGCPGGVYTPAAGHTRMVRISVQPSSGPLQVFAPDMRMDSVPNAIVAETVQGLSRDNMLEINKNAQMTQSNFENIFGVTNYPKLTALLAGQFPNAGGALDAQNQRISNIAAPTAGGDAVNRTYADGTIGGNAANTGTLLAGDVGKVMVWDGAKWVASAPAGDATKLPLDGTGTMTGNLNMGNQNIINAGHIVQIAMARLQIGRFTDLEEGGLALVAGDIGSLWYNTDDKQLKAWNGVAIQEVISSTTAAGGDLTGTYPNPTIANNAVTTAKINDGAVTTSKLFANPGTNYLVTTDGTTGANLVAKACAADQVLAWSGTPGLGWQCVTATSLVDSSVIRDGGNTRGAPIVIGTNDNQGLNFEVNNTVAVQIKSDGKLGVGGIPIVSFDDSYATDALGIPRGTTAERPVSPVNGYIRYNSDLKSLEGYVNGGWQVVASGTSPTGTEDGKSLRWNDTTKQFEWYTALTAVSNQASLADGKVWIGDGLGKAQEQTLSGDVTVSNAGVTAIGVSKVDSAKIADAAVTDAKINTVSVNKITSAAGQYFSYAPNGVACANNEILTWDNSNARWSCATNIAGSAITSLTGDVVATGPGATAAVIVTSAIDSAKIADGAVGLVDLAVSSVDSSKIVDGAIATVDIAVSAITSALIADGTIALVDMADNSVDGSKVVDGSLTGADLASSTVADSNIIGVSVDKVVSGAGKYFTYLPNNVACGDGEVMSWDNTNGRWGCASPTAGSVTSIATGTGLTGGPINSTGTISIAAGGVSNTELADSAVNSAKISDGAVALADMANNSVDGAKVVDGSLTGTDLAANTVADSNIIGVSVDKVTSGAGKYLTYAPNGVACTDTQILTWDNTNARWSCAANASGTAITELSGDVLATGPGNAAATIATSAINSAKIADGSVATVDIATSAITSALIADGTIALVDLADNSVDGSKILDGAVGTVDLANLAVTDGKINDVGVDKVTSGAGKYFTYLPNNVACGDGEVMAWDNTTGHWGCASPTAGSVTSIATGTGLTGGPINSTGTISIAAGGVSNTELADSAVNSAKIADGTVAAVDLASDSVTNAKLADSAVGTNEIADAAVTDAKINTVSISKVTSAAGQYLTYAPNGVACADTQILTWDNTNARWSCAANASGTAITELSGDVLATGPGNAAATIATSAINSAKIADGSIATVDIATSAITSALIADGTIALADLADSSVDGSKVVDGSLTAADLASSVTDGLWSVNGANIYRQSNVGIGVTNPTVKLAISANASPQAPTSETVLHLTNADNSKTRLTMDSFGPNDYPTINMRVAHNTGAAPTAISSNSSIGYINGIGYGDTGYASGGASIGFLTTENWTDAANGSRIIFQTSPNGSNSKSIRMTVNHNGNVGIGNTQPGVSLDVGSKTDAIALPSGTTAQRPAAPVNGYTRYNTDQKNVEAYINGGWQVIAAGTDPAGGQDGQSLRWNNTTKQFDWFTAAAGGSGVQTINGDSTNAQTIVTGSAGTDFGIGTTAGQTVINLPSASAANRGLLTSADWTTFNNKLAAISNVALLADGKIWVGDGSGKAQEQTMSGDVTMTNGGVTSIGVSKVDSNKIADGAIAAVDLASDSVTNAKLADSAVNTNEIADAAVTDAKINTVSISKVTSAAGQYLTYAPNGVACADTQILTWDNTNARWSCAANASGTAITELSGDVLATGPGNAAATIATSAINSAKIADGSIATVDIATSAITSALIADGAVGLADMAVSSVDSGKIVDGTIVGADIASSTVADSNIIGMSVDKVTSGAGKYFTYLPNNVACGDGEVMSWDNANARWSCGNPSAGSVTSIATGTGLTGGPINSTGTISIAAGGVSNIELADSAVNSAKIADGTVAAVDLASDSVTNAKLADSAVNTNEIVDAAVTDAKINTVSISKVTSAAGQYLTYAPNGVACGNGEILTWDNTNARWSCAANASGTAITELSGDVLATGPGNAAATIATSAINSAKIADGSIATVDIATSAITSALIADGTIALADLADNSVDGSKILDGAVGTVDLANLAVTDGKVNDVGVDKITSGSGKYFTYAPNGVVCGNGEILSWDNTNARWSCAANAGATAVTELSGDVLATGPGNAAATIATSAINSAKIADGAVALADLAVSSVDSSKIVDGSIAAVDLASDAVTTIKILDSNVTDAKIAGMSIDKLLNGSGKYFGYMPNGVACADGEVITWDNSNARWVCGNPSSGSVTSIATGTGLTGGPINSTGTISIAAGGVSNTELADSAVNSAKIADGTVAAVDLASDSVTNAKLADSAVNTNEIVDAAVTDAKINTVSISKVTSAAGQYLTYAPNGVACADTQILTWDNTNARWSCAANASGTAITELSGDVLATGPGNAAATIATSAINSAKIADGSIATVDIATSAITSALIADGTIALADLANNSVDGSKIVDGSLTGTDLAANTVADANIIGMSIDKLLNGSGKYFGYMPNGVACADGEVITWDNSNARWVCGNPSSGAVTSIATGTGLTGGPINSTGTISIAAGGVSNTELADSAVNSAKIADGSVALADLAVSSVDGGKVVDGSLTGADLASSTVADSNIIGVSVDKVTSGAGKYFTYAPNGVACADTQILTWDNTNARWSCAANASATAMTSLTGDVTATGAGAAVATIAVSAVDSNKIADGGVALADLAVSSVDSSKIVDGSVATADLQNGNKYILDGGNATGATIGIGTTDTQALQFLTNNAPAMTISSSGGVGIGSTNPGTTVLFSKNDPIMRLTNTNTTQFSSARLYFNTTEVDNDGSFYYFMAEKSVNGAATGGTRFELRVQDGDGDRTNVMSVDGNNRNITFQSSKTAGASYGNVSVANGNFGVGNSAPAYTVDLSTRTDGIVIPRGTTAQRPASPTLSGLTRYNTDTKTIEYYSVTNTTWYTLAGAATPTSSEDGKSLRWDNATQSFVWFTAGAAGAGVQTINGDGTNAQILTTGTAGTDFGIGTTAGTTVFNLPSSSASNRGLLTSADWTTFNGKLGAVSNTASLADGKVWVGDGSGKAQEQTLSGDVTVSNAGVTAIGVSKVDSNKIADGAVAAVDLASDAVTTVKILDNNVTDAKIAGMSVDKLTSASGKYLTYAPNGVACADTQILAWDNASGHWVCATPAVNGLTQLTGDVTASGSGSQAATIAVSAVNSAKIADGTVALADLAVSSVDSSKIVDGSLTSADFASSVGVWSVNGADVYRSAGNVGVGTTAPGSKVEVVGGNLYMNPADGSGAMAAPSVTDGIVKFNNRYDNSGNSTTNKLMFYDTATSRYGIGVSTQSFNLFAGNSSEFNFYSDHEDETDPGVKILTVSTGGLNISTTLNPAARKELIFSEAGTNSMGLSYEGSAASPNNKLHIRDLAGGTDLMTFLEGGNVGVGTTSPNSLFTVAGVAALGETTAPSGTANYGKLYVKSSDSKLYFMDDGGVEKNLSDAGSSPMTVLTGDVTASGTGAVAATIAVSAVDSNKIADGTIVSADVSSIDYGKLSNASGNYLNYMPNGTACADTQILAWDNASGHWVCSSPAVSGLTELTGDVTASGVGSQAATIAVSAINSAKIADGTVALADLATSSVDASKIVDGSITSAKLATSYLPIGGGTMSGSISSPLSGSLPVLDGSNTTVSTAGTRDVLVMALNPNPSANYATNYTTSKFSATMASANNQTGGSMTVLSSSATHSGTGSMLNLTSGNFTLSNTAGTITDAYAVKASVTNSATVTNGYGVYVGSVQATNKFSIFASDSAAPSYFAGNVGIGTSTPGSLLTVEGVTALRETAAPSNTANYGKLYVKSADSKLYFMDDGGVEKNLSDAGSSPMTVLTGDVTASGSGAVAATIAVSAIDSNKIADGTIVSADVSSIDYGKLSNASGNYLNYMPNGTACADTQILAWDNASGHWVCSSPAVSGLTQLTGDVTASGVGSQAATIATSAITSAKIADGTIVAADLATSLTDGLWSVNGADVYRAAGNVGIGTTAPTVPLEVAGRIIIAGAPGATGHLMINGGNSTATGHSATVIGTGAGVALTSAISTTIVGNGAGAAIQNGGGNTLVGKNAGAAIVSGQNNTMMGNLAGAKTTGAENVYIGHAAGYENTTGARNVGVGRYTLNNFVTAGNSYNVAVGEEAMEGVLSQSTGIQNTALGGLAGNTITTGSRNIVIGYNVQLPSGATDDWLNIGNTIYANLATDKVGIGATSPNEILTVGGVTALLETSAPSQTANYGKLYVKSSDSKLYFMDDGGVEKNLSDAGGSPMTVLTGDVTASGTGAVATTISVSAIDSSKIADGAVALADLAVSSVDGGKIVDGSVALVDMAVSSVDTNKIVDGTIAGVDIAAAAIGLSNMAVSSVDGSHIVDGAVALPDLAVSSVDSGKIVDGTVASVDITDGTIASADIAVSAITTSLIADGAVGLADLAVSSVDGSKIVDGSISSADLASTVTNGLWSVNGSDIYRASGNVGIGITNPFAIFEVSGGTTPGLGTATGAMLIRSNSTAALGTYGGGIIFGQLGGATAGNQGAAIHAVQTSGDVNNVGLAFEVHDSIAGNDRIEMMRMDGATGFIGVGTTNAGTDWDIQKADRNTGVAIANTSSTATRNPFMVITNYTDGFGGYPNFTLRTSGGNLTTPADTATSADIGHINFQAREGANYRSVAGIYSSTGANFSSTDKEGILTFLTNDGNNNTPFERMRIDQTGKVGIGTTNPAELLTVSNPTADSVAQIGPAGVTDTSAGLKLVGRSAGTTNYASIYAGWGGELLLTPATGSLGIKFRNNSGGDAMFINGTGSVGVGTTVPVALMTVEGVAALRETTAPSNTANYGKLYVKSSDSKLYFMDDSGAETDLLAGGSSSTILTGDVTASGSGSVAATIAVSAVDSNKIADGAVALADLALSSVDSSKIVDGTIALADMANNSVNGSIIVDGSVTGTDLASATVALANMANNSVNAAKILDGSVTGTDLASATVALANMANNSVDASKILNGSVTGTDLASATVALANMANNSVDGSKILDGSITAADLATSIGGTWGINGSDVFRASGNVGIGSSVPDQMLHLERASADIGIRFKATGGTLGDLGTRFGGTSAVDATIGTETWNNTGNALASDNAYSTTANGLGNGDISRYLKVTNFGFSAPPASAVITGIEVFVEAKMSGTINAMTDYSVKIVKGGTVLGTDHAAGAGWLNGTDSTKTYGSSTDLWGTTWNASDITASDFGVAISFTHTSGLGSSTPNVDGVSIKVHYADLNGLANWVLGSDNADSGKFKINNSAIFATQNYLTIDQSGNMGIGTSVPNSLLTVEGVTALKETAAPTNTANYGKMYVKSSDSKLYFMDDGGVEYDLTGASVANNAIDSAKILDGSIGTVDIATSAISSALISDGVVTGTDLASGTVALANMANNSVDGSKVLDGSITAADFASSVGVWSVNGSDVYRSGANVGIGTSDPTIGFSFNANNRFLAVAGNGAASAFANGGINLINNRATATAGDETGQVNFMSLNNGGGNDLASRINGGLEGSGGANGLGGNLSFMTKGDNVSGSPTIRMRIDSSGNVGIGLTNPSRPLEVAATDATATTTAANTAVIRVSNKSAVIGSEAGIQFHHINSGSDANVMAGISSSLTYAGGNGESDMIFSVHPWNGSNLVEAMRLKPTGRLGIGTTDPGSQLEVNGGTGADTTIRVFADNTHTAAVNLGTSQTDRWTISHDTTNGLYFFEDHTGDSGATATRMVLAAGGKLGIGNIASPNEQLTVDGALSLNEMTAPSNTANYGKIYVKSSDSLLYFQTDGGTEYNLTAASVANNAIDSAKILDGSIGTVDIATSAISSALIADGVVTGADLASSTVALANMANNSVDGSKILDGSITAADFASSVGVWSVNGADVYRASGNVGIGTTAPTSTLSFDGEAARSIAMERILASDTAGSGLTVQAGGATVGATDKNGGTLTLSSGMATGFGGSNMLFKVATQASGAGVTDRTPSTVMALELRPGAPLLGLGSTAPGYTMDIRATGPGTYTSSSAGSSEISTNWGNPLINLQNESSTNRSMSTLRMSVLNSSSLEQHMFISTVSTSGAGVYTPSLVFVSKTGATAYNERMRINSNGNVGIGTTNPGSLLDVNGTVTATGFVGPITAASSSTTAGYTINSNSDASGSDGGFTLKSGAANLITVNDAGDTNITSTTASTSSSTGALTVAGGAGIGGSVVIGGDLSYTGALTDISDVRLKHDIQPLTGALDKLGHIRGVSFRMNSNPDRVEDGVIAQEIEPQFPELVFTKNDEMQSKSVNYIGFIGWLIEAVKELKAKIDALIVSQDAKYADLVKKLEEDNKAKDQRIQSLEERLMKIEQNMNNRGRKPASRK